MFPMSFREFLVAIDEAGMADLLSPASPRLPIDHPFHRRLVDAMRIHMLIGGMPAVVEAYRSTRDALACLHILDDVLSTLYDDFAKYKKRAPVIRLRETFESVSRQAGGKFAYIKAANGNPTSGYKDALELLVRAHLTHRVHHTAAHGLPLGAEIDTRTFKALPFDTGIHLRLLGLDIRNIIAGEGTRLVNEGSNAEVYAGIELIAGQSPRLHPQMYYWRRQSPGSNAEVDYVLARQGTIHAIEVKAGTRGQMQSLHRFLDEHAGARGIRASLENFSSADRFDIIPLYALGAFLGEP
jgi:predicted AAA+ superfamily ATPase